MSEEAAPAEIPASVSDIVAKLEATRAPAQPAAEAPKPPAPPAEKPQEKPAEATSAPLSRALQAERRAQEERARVKSERAELESSRAELAKKEAALEEARREYEETMRLLKDDPRELFRRRKLDPAAFTKALATGARVPPEVREMEARIQKIEEDRSKAEKETAARAAQEHEAQRAQVAAAFVARVSATEFPAAAEYLTSGQPGEVRAKLETVVRDFHAAHGRIPTDAEAAQVIESELTASAKARASRPWFESLLKEMGYVKAAASGQAPAAAQSVTKGGDSERAQPVTLTTSHATAAPAGHVDPTTLSDEERYELAIAQLERERRR